MGTIGTTNSGAFNADGSLNLGGLVGSTLTGASTVYGAQNNGQAIQQGNTAAAQTQTNAQNAINGIYSTQATTGNNAMSTLASVLGTGGNAPDPSVFMNQPGYQFAVQQGTQAINRQAAAGGNLYTPNTLTSVGQYVTGTANANYNQYVQQLLSAAGLGAQANSGLANANLATSNNISQTQINSGNAAGNAAQQGASGVASTLQSLLSGSGASTGVSGLLSKIGSMFSGGGSGSAGTDPYGTGVTSGVNPGTVDPNAMYSALDGSGVSTDTSGINPGTVDPSTYGSYFSDPSYNP